MDTTSPFSALSDVSLPSFATCPKLIPTFFSSALLGFESPPLGLGGVPSFSFEPDSFQPASFEPALDRTAGLGDGPKLFVQATMSRSRRM